MQNFHWSCPYCNRSTTITQQNHTSHVNTFFDNNKDGFLALVTRITTCPSPQCKEYEIKAALYKASNASLPTGNPMLEWQLRPQSNAKPFPQYIPKPLRDDYTEACTIRDLSPKASATLSRRCLQGIIRDYWGIKKARLIDEVHELNGHVDSATWQAIDSVRSIGNIGAHMEKDINVIVDVEPEEAQLLIGLIEILFKDWYIARHERQAHLDGIVAIAKAKAARRSGG